MAPAVKTYTGHRFTGHVMSSKAAAALKTLSSKPLYPDEPYDTKRASAAAMSSMIGSRLVRPYSVICASSRLTLDQVDLALTQFERAKVYSWFSISTN